MGDLEQGWHRSRAAADRPCNIAKVAAARELLTLVFYGMRDHQIRCLSRPAAGPPPAADQQAA